jgi:phospholipid/cholesterol/gamma-HCH transport system substrate-binding protein
MRTTKNTRAVIVGLFIILGLVIFAFAVLALSGQKKTFGDTIAVKALFSDVSGLQNGSNVWYSGVKVGIVKGMSFMPNAQVQVDMEIEDNKKQYIPKDAKVKVGSDGLIGNKVLIIFGGTPQASVIANGDVLKAEAVVTPDELLNTFQTNNKNLVDITGDIKQISRRVLNGEGSVGKLLKDETLVNDLQTVVTILRRTSANAQQLTNDISGYTANLRKPGTITNYLLTDTVLFNRLRSTVRQVDELSASAKTMVTKLNSTTENLTDSSSTAGMLLTDKSTAADIKEIIRNLQTGTEKLNEDLEALQHNFLLRGFFKKKAKQKTEQK